MFFGKKRKETGNNNLIKIGALLIHAAKIDENYSKIENELIKKALIKFGAEKDDLEILLNKAKDYEENTNQILDFTKEVKSMKEDEKITVIETLWKIIYSNQDADIYETNLMRRLSGLLYIDSKTMGNIKEKIKNQSSK